jgi:hypothetical protein
MAFMAREAATIDITGMPDLIRLAEEVARTRTPRVLRRGDEDVAVLSPAPPKRRPKGKQLTPARREAVLATAGAWKGHIDAERFKREIKDARSDDRPPVTL